MLTRNPTAPGTQIDPVPVLLAHLENGNDVIRVGVIRALATLAPGDDRARGALLTALRDEDPDVRTDAMEALAVFARPEDAEIIRESLAGDPVREVKLMAITRLVELGDNGSVPLFSALAQDRCEDAVAWEDGIGLWDEWLEVQSAVIRALGDLEASETLQNLLTARDDEFGQNLDLPVFSALSQMGSEGLIWLLSIARTESGLARKRALEAMARLDKEALRDHVDYLFGDQDAAVRRLILPMLEASDDRAAALALMDPNADLRAEALARYVIDRPDLAVLALADTSEKVQAIALNHLSLPLNENLAESLPANMAAWLISGEGALGTATARNWFRLFPKAAVGPLLDLVLDETRPLEARIAAVQELAGQQDEASTERLVSLLGDPAQQVRLASLTCLIDRVERGDGAATDALALAAEGALLSPEAAVVKREEEAGVDATADSDDHDDVPRLQINGDGAVVTADEQTGTGSTLAAIQLARVPTETSKKGRAQRKRRAVEGSDDVALDLACVTLGLIGAISADNVTSAIVSQTQSPEDALRSAAFRALAAQPDEIRQADAQRGLIARGLLDRCAAVRVVAADMATRDPALRDDVAILIKDEDVLVRAAAVRVMTDPSALLSALADPGAAVRTEALSQLAMQQSQALSDAAFQKLVEAGRIDTLRSGISRDLQMQVAAIKTLADPELSKRDLHVVLGSLGAHA